MRFSPDTPDTSRLLDTLSYIQPYHFDPLTKSFSACHCFPYVVIRTVYPRYQIIP